MTPLHSISRRLQALALLVTLLMVGCQPPPPLLERIQASGRIVVGAIDSPTSYYALNDDAWAGFDYTLMNRYAESNGFEISWRVYTSQEDMLDDLESGRIQIAATGIPVTDAESQRHYLAPAYNASVPVLVQHRRLSTPDTLDVLEGTPVLVSPSALDSAKLEQLMDQHPDVDWDADDNRSAMDVLAALQEGRGDFAVLSDHLFHRLRPLFPDLVAHVTLGDPQPIAWALSRSEDASLLASVTQFFSTMDRSGTLNQLRDQYFARSDFNQVQAKAFLQHVDARLPRYEQSFRDAGDRYGLDWRLLAAIGYQESLWDPHAISSTGVTGLMMLSRRAAIEVGVKDRRNPHQSIRGGAQYLRQLHDRLPRDIAPQDRLWFALAAYNMGLGHLYDARRLTQSQGGNPSRWLDVEKRLPLLQQPAYYRHARHGYSRGARQAVAYVRAVRRYYDTLVWASLLPDREYLTAQGPADFTSDML